MIGSSIWSCALRPAAGGGGGGGGAFPTQAATYIYAVKGSTNNLYRLRLSNNSEEFLANSANESLEAGIGISTNRGKVYLCGRGGGKVYRCNLDGSSLETFISGVTEAIDIVIDDPNDLGYVCLDAGERIFSFTLGGATQSTILAGGGDYLGIAQAGSGGDLYVISEAGLELWRVTLAGATTNITPAGLTVEGGWLKHGTLCIDHLTTPMLAYYGEDNGTRILQFKLDGTSMESVWSGSDSDYSIRSLRLDPITKTLYFYDADSSAGAGIQRVSISAGTNTLISGTNLEVGMGLYHPS